MQVTYKALIAKALKRFWLVVKIVVEFSHLDLLNADLTPLCCSNINIIGNATIN